jgi:hypothetical protein
MLLDCDSRHGHWMREATLLKASDYSCVYSRQEGTLDSMGESNLMLADYSVWWLEASKLEMVS